MYKINSNDFKILEKYKDFMNKLDDILENVPRKDMFYKDLIRQYASDNLMLILKCSYEGDYDRVQEYYVDIKGHLSMLDFMLDRLYNKRYISEKATFSATSRLVEVNKMVSGWIANMVESGSKIK